jgi:hypothetical protein
MPKKKNITIGDILVYKFYSGMGRIFKIFFLMLFPKKLSADRALTDLNLLIFSGERGGKMLKAVLLSVYNTWDQIPMITIATDGTPVAYFEKILKFWPFPYSIKVWNEYAAFHTAKDGGNLAIFGERNLLARKLLAVLAEGENRPTLYCDTDVLWFGEPRLPVPSPMDKPVFRMSTDNAHFYHLPVIRYFNRQDMLEKTPLNSGVVYISGSVYDHYPEFKELIGFVKIFDEPFAEQTTFALIGEKLGDRWNANEIILTTKDLHWPLIPKYFFSGDHFARHHVMTKHSWFWRDALYILLFKRPKSSQVS